MVRLMDAEGNPVSAETQAHPDGEGQRRFPAVQALSGGGFAVGWEWAQNDISEHAIEARVFDDGGVPLSPVIRVAETGYWAVSAPGIAALSEQRFILAWTDNRLVEGEVDRWVVAARAFTGQGVAESPVVELAENSYSLSNGDAILSCGERLFVSWIQNRSEPGHGKAVFGRMLSTTMDPLGEHGEPFMLSLEEEGSQQFVRFAQDESRGAVAVWLSSRYDAGQDTNVQSIRAQRFNCDGSRRYR